MMQRTRSDEPWIRSAARGVGFVILAFAAVVAGGLVLSFGFAWVMG
jgi:hypothetical protein